MRTFTEEEKKILNIVAEVKNDRGIDSLTLIDIYNLYVRNKHIYIELTRNQFSNRIDFNYSSKHYQLPLGLNKVKRIQSEIEHKFIDTIFLLEYLKENKLMFEITAKNDVEELKIGKIEGDYVYRRNDCNFDSETTKYILDLTFKKRYYIREEFVEFVRNDFKTNEDLKYSYNKRITWISIALSFAIGLWSIGMNVSSNIASKEISKQRVLMIDSCMNSITSMLQTLSDGEIKVIKDVDLKIDSLINETRLNRPLKSVNSYVVNFPKGKEDETKQH